MECVAAIASFRLTHSEVLPASISDEEAGLALGILNTNQLEVTGLNGSGLFLQMAVVEHSCAFNSSFFTHTRGDDVTKLTLTATRRISAGDFISIDYGNNFYRPTEERQESLLRTYGFTCLCALCSAPDSTRCFRCSMCSNGILYFNEWKCGDCGASVGKKEKTLLLREEGKLLNSLSNEIGGLLTTLEDIQELAASSKLARQHYSFFWMYSELALFLNASCCSSSVTRKGKNKQQKEELRIRRSALDAMKSAVALLDEMLPEVHHERVIYYDRLGQMAVAAGSTSEAKAAFSRAHAQSCLIHGRDFHTTIVLASLTSDTPTDLPALLLRYDSATEDFRERKMSVT